VGWWGRETGRIQKERNRVHRHLWVPTQGRYNGAFVLTAGSQRGIMADALLNSAGDFVYYQWRWPRDFVSLFEMKLLVRGDSGTGNWNWFMDITGIVEGDNQPTGAGEATASGALAVTVHEVYELDLTASVPAAQQVAEQFMAMRIQQTSAAEDAAAVGLSITYVSEWKP
jgi:hypothetical protein